MMSMTRNNVQGFSLVELTVVLLLITLIAGVAVRETSELTFQTRYEQTRERLEMIRQAILGNPRQIINGQQAVSGFVADMGRLPYSLRELVEDYDCDGPLLDGNGDTNSTNDGGCPWSPDAAFGSGLGAGWRGPYLNISGNPSDNDAFSDGWGRVSADGNYGWLFSDLSALMGNGNNRFVQSFGKNQVKDGAVPTADSFDNDYPPNHPDYGGPTEYFPKPLVSEQDWRVDLAGGLSVSFKKSAGKISPVSHCSDLTINDKSSCVPPGGTETWTGGCNKAGYFNKSSCTDPVVGGTWSNCSDGTSASKTACESAGKEWYGEGFGCSDQSKSLRAQCTSPNVWRSCSDDGSITDESACLAADQHWYGDTIFNNALSTQKVCMKVFYRKSDSTIGLLISDENVTNDSPTVHSDPKTIMADGGFQSLRFANLRDSATGVQVFGLPIGTGAIGIYRHDGTDCTDQFYPSDRQSPAQVDFHAHAGVPVINW